MLSSSFNTFWNVQHSFPSKKWKSKSFCSSMISVFRTLVDLFLRWNRKKLFYFAQRSMHLNIFLFFCHPIQHHWGVSQYQTQYSVVGCAWRMEEWRRDPTTEYPRFDVNNWACYWENARSCWLIYRQGWWPDATGYFLNQHQAKEKGVSWLNKSIQINIKVQILLFCAKWCALY